MAEAIAECQRIIGEICDLQLELFAKVGVQKAPYEPKGPSPVYEQLKAKYYDAFKAAKQTIGKQNRAAAGQGAQAAGDGRVDSRSGSGRGAFAGRVRRRLASSGRARRARSDSRRQPCATAAERKTCGRSSAMVDVLPRVHGSAVFQRGETQALITITLGTGRDEQRVDGLIEEYSKKFMLDYNFPPFSVGEAQADSRSRPARNRPRSLGRAKRQAGAARSREFPYTIRVISDILESNGSSSMASVCGATLGLMAAGVPITQPGRRNLRRPGEGIRLASGFCSPTSSAMKTTSATWISKSPEPRTASRASSSI